MSIKFAISGEIDVETKRGSYRLSNKRFLLLNAWEPYTFQIAGRNAAKTFSLFFRAKYLSGIEETLVNSDEKHLDDGPAEGLSQHLEFPEALFPADSHAVGARLKALFTTWQSGASAHCLSDRVRDIAEALVNLRSGTRLQLENIAALKRSTREELFRRAQLATIFVRENYRLDIDLNVVARQVAMAPHHLHRTFRAVHGFTVHQELVRNRLAEAKRLLSYSDAPVQEICRRVGYSSAPSFTKSFKRHFGYSPSEGRTKSPD
jgi:AraC-like DNA-binding protein